MNKRIINYYKNLIESGIFTAEEYRDAILVAISIVGLLKMEEK